MKIMLTGGGTLGPVTPLLAVAEKWKEIDPKVEFIWVGTKNGPEREYVQLAGIPFLHIPVARFPRYPTIEWIFLPFKIIGAFMMAWFTLGREKPNLVASAGGFTGVPLMFAAKLKGIPTWIHQQDAHTLLSNKLVASVASCITVAWESTARKFPKGKTHWIGNPVRPSVLKGKKDRAHELFGIDLQKPTVLIFGGGSGAVWINHMISEISTWLSAQANVIHITGKGKLTPRLKSVGKRYYAVEFLTDEMAHALAAADVVVCRAGMGTITEMAALKKACVMIPIPGSVAQMKNAKHLSDTRAATVLNQRVLSVGDLKKAIKDLLEDKDLREKYGARIHALLPTDVSEQLIRHVVLHCKS